ncbi:MAG: amidase, partial [Pseudomonadota bacterium]
MKDPDTYVEASAVAIGRAMADGLLDPVAFTECLLDRIGAQTSPVFLKVTSQRALAEAKAARA